MARRGGLHLSAMPCSDADAAHVRYACLCIVRQHANFQMILHSKNLLQPHPAQYKPTTKCVFPVIEVLHVEVLGVVSRAASAPRVYTRLFLII